MVFLILVLGYIAAAGICYGILDFLQSRTNTIFKLEFEEDYLIYGIVAAFWPFAIAVAIAWAPASYAKKWLNQQFPPKRKNG